MLNAETIHAKTVKATIELEIKKAEERLAGRKIEEEELKAWIENNCVPAMIDRADHAYFSATFHALSYVYLTDEQRNSIIKNEFEQAGFKVVFSQPTGTRFRVEW